MEPHAYLSAQDLAKIDARARRLRAEAMAEAFTAITTWVRDHLSLAATKKV